MSCYPERFDDISYIIIDEVHERSVSTDLLCLLCRRMLQTNKNMRLILMSATLAAALYQNYFNVPEPPIKVGARRFQVEEVYIEDIETRITLPKQQKVALQSISQECLKMKCLRSPSLSYMEKLYALVSFLATSVGTPGSSVLIFVPGMQDIVTITEMIELVYIPNVKFVVFPIHSDIPFEDQMNAFVAAGANEVKIIIATNSAESSVTIPDVDHIICLGLCKQIVYNEASHRQMLVPTWISRASANQRKGRAGRLRPGCVYRIYPRFVFENNMDEFEPGEISRMPLDSVILMLKVMLPQEATTNLLKDCIEPPDTKNINRSFLNLYQSHFITRDDEDSEVTLLGSFVCSIGIDLTLGSLIGLGIQNRTLRDHDETALLTNDIIGDITQAWGLRQYN
jgi:ATP-dependent RNA helicase DHX57